jgi:hypothetical protein
MTSALRKDRKVARPLCRAAAGRWCALLLLAAGAQFLALSPLQAANAKKSDSDIKQAVQAALRLDPRVAAFSLDVNVGGGVVVLSGNVGNLKAKTSAEQDVENIVGVTGLDSFLKVRPAGQSIWIGWGEADKDARRSGATGVVNRVKVKTGAWWW